MYPIKFLHNIAKNQLLYFSSLTMYASDIDISIACVK